MIKIIIGLTVLLALTATKSPAQTVMTGYLADEKCARQKRAESSSHAACAKRCVGQNERIVFVNAANHRIYIIANPATVAAQVGRKVTLTGAVVRDRVRVQRVE